ncbi:MAG: FAD-dependent oxidoreductase [Thermoproteota archaeon]|nr:FAD-dependent oxidoreductase [Candidatus Brockarchaeota archaeon]
MKHHLSLLNSEPAPELISEKVKPNALKYNLKELSAYWNFDLHVSEVKTIDLNQKIVKTKDKELSYDILVIAAGSEPNFFEVLGKEFMIPAYSLSDFTLINEKMKQLKENSKVVVVGAGFVGLEVVAEILDLFNALKRRINLTVIEKMDAILPAYPNDLAKKLALEHFSSKGIKILLGKGVKQVNEDKVILEDGQEIEADLTIWTAGIKASELSHRISGAKLNKGCIEVDEKLLVRGKEDAFAIGDIAYVNIGGKLAQKMAGEALEQGKTVAKNIARIANNEKPNVTHNIVYTTDFPKVLLSLGEGKAMLIFGPQYATVGTVEYFLKVRIDQEEMMQRFP